MRTGAIIMLWLLLWGLFITQDSTPLYAEYRVIPTSAIVPPTYTPTATSSTAVATNTATSTPVWDGSTSSTQTAVAMVTQTAVANLSLTASATPTAAASSTAVAATATPNPTQVQPSRLPNTGVVDSISVWQNQPLFTVMVITGVLGMAFMIYGRRD